MAMRRALGARARRDGAVRGVRRAHRRTRALRTESQPPTLATGAPCGALGLITSAVAAATRVQTPMAMRRALGARARRVYKPTVAQIKERYYKMYRGKGSALDSSNPAEDASA